MTVHHKQCPCCKRKFLPDPRIGNRQRFCSRKACQQTRQRKNESDWRERNPDCVKVQNFKWRQQHPGYLQEWRTLHPEAVERNRMFMRRHMRRIRERKMFEKSKEMHLQMTGRQGDVYVSRGRTWLFARLKRASLWSGTWVQRYACGRIKAKSMRLPGGRMYAMPSTG